MGQLLWVGPYRKADYDFIFDPLSNPEKWRYPYFKMKNPRL